MQQFNCERMLTSVANDTQWSWLCQPAVISSAPITPAGMVCYVVAITEWPQLPNGTALNSRAIAIGALVLEAPELTSAGCGHSLASATILGASEASPMFHGVATSAPSECEAQPSTSNQRVRPSGEGTEPRRERAKRATMANAVSHPAQAPSRAQRQPQLSCKRSAQPKAKNVYDVYTSKHVYKFVNKEETE